MRIFTKVISIFLNGICGATTGTRHGHGVLLFWHMLKNANFDSWSQYQKVPKSTSHVLKKLCLEAMPFCMLNY